jgi:hypothetical protein
VTIFRDVQNLVYGIKREFQASETPSLSKMLCRWFFTVCSLINIFSAISLFLYPCATSVTISRSRVLNGDRSRPRPPDELLLSSGLENWRITAAVVCESSQISPPYTFGCS